MIFAFVSVLSLVLVPRVAVSQEKNVCEEQIAGVAVKPSPWNWMLGHWRVSYFDQNVGTVKGYAVVYQQPSNVDDGAAVTGGSSLTDAVAADPAQGPIIPQVFVNLRDPFDETGEYFLTSTDLLRDGGNITIKLEGRSPSLAKTFDGKRVATKESGKAAPVVLRVPRGSQITARLEGAEANAKSAEDNSALARLELKFPLTDEASEKLVGVWAQYPNGTEGFKGLRSNKFDKPANKMLGPETWQKADMLITKVSNFKMLPFAKIRHKDDAGLNPIIGDTRDPDAMVETWLRIEGKNLPVERSDKVDIKFVDPNVVYGGVHRASKKVKGALEILVALKKTVRTGKKVFALNTLPAVWHLNYPALDPVEVRFVRPIAAADETVEEFRENKNYEYRSDEFYEKTDVLYSGEVFHVEVEFAEEQFIATRDFGIFVAAPGEKGGSQAEAKKDPVQFEVFQDKKNAKIFRSKPMIVSAKPLDLETADFLPPANSQGPPADNSLEETPEVIVVPDLARLIAVDIDTVVPKCKDKAIAIATVHARSQPLWERALGVARQCRKAYPDNYKSSNWIIYPTALRSLGITGDILLKLYGMDKDETHKRTIEITPQSHAAMILVHEAMQKKLGGYIDNLQFGQRDNPEKWDKTQKLLRRHLPEYADNDLSHALFVFDVSTPDGKGKVPLKEALTTAYARQKGLTPEARGYYIARVIAEAQAYSLSAARGARSKLDAFSPKSSNTGSSTKKPLNSQLATSARKNRSGGAPGQCDVLGLLKLVGVGTYPVSEYLARRIVRPPKPGEPKHPALVPDKIARAELRSLGALSQAITAQTEFSKADTYVAQAVASMFFVGAGSGAGNTILLEALEFLLVDLGPMIYEAQAWTASRDDVLYGQGIAGIAGTDRYDYAKAREQGVLDLVLISAPAAGPIGGRAAGRGLTRLMSPSKAAVKHAIDKGLRHGLRSLNKTEMKALRYAQDIAKKKLAAKGWDGLTKAERNANVLGGYTPVGKLTAQGKEAVGVGGKGPQGTEIASASPADPPKPASATNPSFNESLVEPGVIKGSDLPDTIRDPSTGPIAKIDPEAALRPPPKGPKTDAGADLANTTLPPSRASDQPVPRDVARTPDRPVTGARPRAPPADSSSSAGDVNPSAVTRTEPPPGGDPRLDDTIDAPSPTGDPRLPSTTEFPPRGATADPYATVPPPRGPDVAGDVDPFAVTRNEPPPGRNPRLDDTIDAPPPTGDPRLPGTTEFPPRGVTADPYATVPPPRTPGKADPHATLPPPRGADTAGDAGPFAVTRREPPPKTPSTTDGPRSSDTFRGQIPSQSAAANPPRRPYTDPPSSRPSATDGPRSSDTFRDQIPPRSAAADPPRRPYTDPPSSTPSAADGPKVASRSPQPASLEPRRPEPIPFADEHVKVGEDSPFKKNLRPPSDFYRRPAGYVRGKMVPHPKYRQRTMIEEGSVVEFADGTRVRIGPHVASGAFTDVFRTQDNPNEVVKVTRLDSPGTKASAGDAVGRRLLEQNQTKDGYFRIPERYGDPVVVKDSEGGLWMLTREKSIAKEVNGELISSAKDRFANRPPNEMERLTGILAVRELNRRGIAWTDHKMANFDIVPADTPTGYRMIIFDTGGMAPMKGSSAAERFDNARRVQQAIDNMKSDSYPQWAKFYRDSKYDEVFDRKPYGLTNEDAIPFSGTPGINRGRIRYRDANNMTSEVFDDMLAERGREIGQDLSANLPPRP